MEARNTVRSDTDLLIIYNKIPNKLDRELILRTIAEAQAEISFKAGKQQGIKEVVDWVEKEKQTAYIYEGQISAYDTKHDTTMLLDLGDWQAFLKDMNRWGK